jgi:hypothetical protein
MPSENGKLESKLAISVVANGQATVAPDAADREKSLSYKCTQCVLDSFELNYGPLTSECKEEILKKPAAFLWKHLFDFWNRL